eukprot:TRINITY_DN1152_c0_g1_i3.p1 TRINITY_DN1152_c0_g1~~TRINITY_DN1152_c0_g1_i3.p1  ORF type:complete len:581 (-),score=194.07 TRINITY_DN1152_c0_g1_i3:3113-4855(-)
MASLSGPGTPRSRHLRNKSDSISISIDCPLDELTFKIDSRELNEVQVKVEIIEGDRKEQEEGSQKAAGSEKSSADFGELEDLLEEEERVKKVPIYRSAAEGDLPEISPAEVLRTLSSTNEEAAAAAAVEEDEDKAVEIAAPVSFDADACMSLSGPYPDGQDGYYFEEYEQGNGDLDAEIKASECEAVEVSSDVGIGAELNVSDFAGVEASAEISIAAEPTENVEPEVAKSDAAADGVSLIPSAQIDVVESESKGEDLEAAVLSTVLVSQIPAPDAVLFDADFSMTLGGPYPSTQEGYSFSDEEQAPASIEAEVKAIEEEQVPVSVIPAADAILFDADASVLQSGPYPLNQEGYYFPNYEEAVEDDLKTPEPMVAPPMVAVVEEGVQAAAPSESGDGHNLVARVSESESHKATAMSDSPQTLTAEPSLHGEQELEPLDLNASVAQLELQISAQFESIGADEDEKKFESLQRVPMSNIPSGSDPSNASGGGGVGGFFGRSFRRKSSSDKSDSAQRPESSLSSSIFSFSRRRLSGDIPQVSNNHPPAPPAPLQRRGSILGVTKDGKPRKIRPLKNIKKLFSIE